MIYSINEAIVNYSNLNFDSTKTTMNVINFINSNAAFKSMVLLGELEDSQYSFLYLIKQLGLNFSLLYPFHH